MDVRVFILLVWSGLIFLHLTGQVAGCGRRRCSCNSQPRTCKAGYTGYPRCNIPICKRGCLHGRCVAPDQCTCNVGWKGTACSEAICSRGCYNGGICYSPERCHCSNGWSGQCCSRAICSKGCYNGGRCIRPETCQCLPGWRGKTCQEAICSGGCHNGGRCDRPDHCICASGWKGRNCKQAICSLGCFNNGKCVAPETCKCASGWQGKICKQAVCKKICQNGAVCVKPDVCDCPKGWTGATCTQEKCGWKHDCYPGSCLQPSAQCQCINGFEGDNCQRMASGPVFQKCEASLHISDDSQQTASCKGETYTNQNQITDIAVDFEQTYMKPPDVKDYPEGGYLRTFRIGLISSSFKLVVKDEGGSVISNKTYPCSMNSAKLIPVESVKCQKSVPFTMGLKHKQKIDILMFGKTGGYKEVLKEDGSNKYINLTITGLAQEKRVSFRYDLHPPEHCSENDNCCSHSLPCMDSIPLSALNDITDVPIISVFFRGWSDPDSNIAKYRLKVYRMSANGEGILQENTKPVAVNNFISTNEAEAYFSLKSPGMYSIIGEVIDLANNRRYCRALVLYATKNQSIDHSNETMWASQTTNIIGQVLWRQDVSNQINVSWNGIFSNPFLDSHKLLAAVKKLPYASYLDYTNGNVTVHGTQHKKGITKFYYSSKSYIQKSSSRKRRSLDPPTKWLEVPGVAESVTLPPVSSGDGITFWVKAEDVMGNALLDYVYIRADNTPPSVTSPVFKKNVTGPEMGYFSRVDLTVIDFESGIHRIDFSIYDVTSEPKIFIGNSTQPGQLELEKDTCLKENTCYCTKVECFAKVQKVFINNCLFTDYLKVPIRFEAVVYNMALLPTTVSLDLGRVEAVSGIEEYPPPYGFHVKRFYGTGAVLGWYLPNACYSIYAVNVDLIEGKSNNPVISPNKTQAELPGLVANKRYTVELYLVYENRQQSEKVVLSFDSGSSGLSVGVIIGIVIGILLFLVIIAIIILMVIRVKVKKQPAVPKRVMTFSANIMNRVSRHFDHHDVHDNLSSSNGKLCNTMNPAYVPEHKLKYTDDDIYVYGEMDTDPDANWKHGFNEVTLGKTLHFGKFAEIRKGTLKNAEGSRLVAVKMLKDHTEDNILLLKAKMNFLATSVPNHNNIVNFVGAVVEGPWILLQYCEQSLKDWLKNVGTITDDVEDNMINFCTDIARGMKHLHDNKIIHRRLGVRNVLLNHIQMMNRIVAKVTGFGPMKSDTVADAGPERIPIKWMAPEQLGLGSKAKRPYNEQTDVWSFGVTVWEIYSNGKTPFGGEKHSEIKRMLNCGLHLERPSDCSQELYEEVMMKCWEYKPEKRPSFSEINNTLEKLFNGSADGAEYYDDQYGMGDMYDQTTVDIYN